MSKEEEKKGKQRDLRWFFSKYLVGFNNKVVFELIIFAVTTYIYINSQQCSAVQCAPFTEMREKSSAIFFNFRIQRYKILPERSQASKWTADVAGRGAELPCSPDRAGRETKLGGNDMYNVYIV